MNAAAPPAIYTLSLHDALPILKLAVAEGDRVGTIEHPIHAGVSDTNGVVLSELMVGGPTEIAELLRPTIGYTVTFGSDRKSTRLNSSHLGISYAVFCLKKKKNT